jgi:hypothetical protein
MKNPNKMLNEIKKKNWFLNSINLIFISSSTMSEDSKNHVT